MIRPKHLPLMTDVLVSNVQKLESKGQFDIEIERGEVIAESHPSYKLPSFQELEYQLQARKLNQQDDQMFCALVLSNGFKLSRRMASPSGGRRKSTGYKLQAASHVMQSARCCWECGITTTVSWRRCVLTGQTLCNACGLYQRVRFRHQSNLRVANAIVHSEQKCNICHTDIALTKQINFILLISRQGKLRLAKWYSSYTLKERQKFIKEVTSLVLARRPRSCNFIEYKDMKIVYKRYASLFFVAGIDNVENELLILEVLHRYVETLDKHFENVCELDLIFNFPKAHFILDEYIMAGEVQEPSMKAVLRAIQQVDDIEAEEQEEKRLF